MAEAKKLALSFDTDRITARQITEFMKAARENDYIAMSEIFALVTTTCPQSWGKPDDPETFANRPFKTEFKQLIEQFTVAMAEDAKN